jgi:DnaJ family protein C protein 28
MEDPIDRAMREGKFDNLPGKGKPLRLDENPHEDPDWRLAHHMLKESGFTLPWIQLRHEIEAETETAYTALRQAWERRQADRSEAGASFTDVAWRSALNSFREQVERINRRIRDYNLQTPSLNFQLSPLNAEREIDRLTAI